MGRRKPRKLSPQVSLYRVQAETSPFTFCKSSLQSITELRRRDLNLGKEEALFTPT